MTGPNILLLTSDHQHYDTLGVTNPRLLLKFVQAEMEREPTRMPRIAGA